MRNIPRLVNVCFKNFYKTMAFVNAIAWIANQENHHPDIEVGYNYCVIKLDDACHYRVYLKMILSVRLKLTLWELCKC